MHFFLLAAILTVDLLRVCSQDFSGGLGDLAAMFSMMAGDCKLTCPRKALPTKNPNHVSSSNGCGSFGLKIDVSQHPGFTACCDAHDICYDTCNSVRSECDDRFKECMNDSCHMNGIQKHHSKKVVSTCEETANMMHSGTVGLGCGAFKEAQRNACLCNGKTLTQQEMKALDEKSDL